jgi:hypothetical protein
MEHVSAVVRTGASVSLTTTTGVGTLTSVQIGTMGSVEIANLSTTGSAAFVFSPIGAPSVTTATTSMRTIPPATVLTESLPQGCTNASAIGIGAANVTVVFTPINT